MRIELNIQKKYKNLTRFEIYEDCRDLSIKYYNSIKGKDILDFDDSIEEFLSKEYNIMNYTHTVAIIKRNSYHSLYFMDFIAKSNVDVIKSFKSKYHIKDNDVECIEYILTNDSQRNDVIAKLRRKADELDPIRFLVLYRIKSTNEYSYEIIRVDAKDINPDDQEQVKAKVIKSGQLDSNKFDDIILIKQSSVKDEDVFENIVKQLNGIQKRV